MIRPLNYKRWIIYEATDLIISFQDFLAKQLLKQLFNDHRLEINHVYLLLLHTRKTRQILASANLYQWLHVEQEVMDYFNYDATLAQKDLLISNILI